MESDHLTLQWSNIVLKKGLGIPGKRRAQRMDQSYLRLFWGCAGSTHPRGKLGGLADVIRKPL